MALDRQKILSELGNVVNQLQSADCGCMGKLFSNSEQGNSSYNSAPNELTGGLGSCGHHGHPGHYGHHGYNAPCAGEPYTGARQCMGYCNPPKLYADTYNYLNNNMMQPVVQEVYDDLKSINPNNTIMNNPMARQMGLSHANTPNQENMPQSAVVPPASINNQMHGHNPHVHFGNALLHPGQQDVYHDPNINHGMSQMNQELSQPRPGLHQIGQGIGHVQHGYGQVGQDMGQMAQGMGQMGQRTGQMEQGMRQTGQMSGMGPQIVNMMSSSAKHNYKHHQVNPSNTTNNKVLHSPEIGQAVPHSVGDPNMRQYNPGQFQNNAAYMGINKTAENYGPGVSNMSQPNMPSGGVGHGNNVMQYNMQQQNPRQQPIGNMNSNSQQVNNKNPYGQHSAGISKFNEMFPGVMKSDLGFDPMAIAIQMNPANQQKSAMDTMQKMMMNNSGGMEKIMDSPQMQPVVNTANAVTASLTQSNQQLTGQADQQNIQQQSQQEIQAAKGSLPNSQIPQQVYAVTGAPTTNQHITSNKLSAQQPHGQIQQISNQQVTSSLPTVYEGSEESVSNQKSSAHTGQPTTIAQHLYKEPIFPADTSRHLLQSHHFKAQKYNYNTLGQPIEMVSAVDYQKLTPNLPQTMSGHGVVARTTEDPMAFANVKATVSKTAIVGNRPMGKTPSRSQLHHEYNQYKGSHSFTQQNIRPSGYTGSHSEGRINIHQDHALPQHYIERVGGDTVTNDQRVNENKPEENVNQIGDVPAPKKPLDDLGMTRARNNKTRNGLQDQVYSSYPTSTKWSFHGTTPAPYSVGYRFKAK